MITTGGEKVYSFKVEEMLYRHLAGFKKPKRIVFFDELPRNAAGKLLERNLRELLATEPESK